MFRFGAWFICWPLLGVMWTASIVGDAMSEVVMTLDDVTDRLLDYAEGDDE